MSRAYDRARELVKAHVRADMPDEIKRLVRGAHADLHFGPEHNGIDEEEARAFPGFEKATIAIGAWVTDNAPRELWVDLDCDQIATSAPEGYEDDDGEWVEPYTEETVYFDYSEIKRAVFGELAEYV